MRKPGNLAFWVWSAAAVLFLAAFLALSILIYFPGNTPRQYALDMGKRLEFSPADPAHVEGRIITLEEAEQLSQPPESPPALYETESSTEFEQRDTSGQTPEKLASVAKPAETPPFPVDSVTQDNNLPPVEEQTAAGILPVIAADGTPPWRYFSRPVEGSATLPRIALIISGLGLSKLPTDAAIALPGAVTLAFSPYANTTQEWVERARNAGHESLLDLPLQTKHYPAADPGPYALLTTLPQQENLTRLTTVLSKARGYVGLLPPAEETFILAKDNIQPVIEALNKRGLIFVSPSSQSSASLEKTAAFPVLQADVLLDAQATEAHIKRQIQKAEILAQQQGTAIVVGQALPVTLDLLNQWITTGLPAKKITLVPITAVIPAP